VALYSVASCGVAGIVCRERVAFVRDAWNAGSGVMLRMAGSVLCATTDYR
jgi:hypothetical protein